MGWDWNIFLWGGGEISFLIVECRYNLISHGCSPYCLNPSVPRFSTGISSRVLSFVKGWNFVFVGGKRQIILSFVGLGGEQKSFFFFLFV